MEKQPAKINYFFKDGYIEFGRTFVNTFAQCGRIIKNSAISVGNSFKKIGHNAKNVITFTEPIGGFFKAIAAMFMVGLYFGKLLLSILLTPIPCAIISVVQAVVLIIFMSLFYICYLIIAFSDWLYRSIKKISTSCPNCQKKYDLPAYICTCGAKHTRLVPSKYGVLKRQCNCGKKLKTTFFNGRHKQDGKWVCPDCGYELSGPLQVDIPIPVVGGPSSGKTCYISMAISQIEKNASSKYGLDFSYRPNIALGDDYEANKRNMGTGRLPEKTNDTRLRYYQFYLTPKGVKVKNLISICDVAGEAYERNDEVGKQIGFKYANAFLMMVDPLSVRKYREEIAKKISLSKYGASERGMDEVLDTLINNLQNMNCLNSKNMIKTDVAVVFTKCDIPGLADKIGESAVRRYMQLHNIRSQYEAANRVCEQFLIEYEEENFLNSLKSKFKSIQFFTCSALGHVENGSNFAPEGVEEPALWLIDKASASIDLKKKWGRKI